MKLSRSMIHGALRVPPGLLHLKLPALPQRLIVFAWRPDNATASLMSMNMLIGRAIAHHNAPAVGLPYRSRDTPTGSPEQSITLPHHRAQTGHDNWSTPGERSVCAMLCKSIAETGQGHPHAARSPYAMIDADLCHESPLLPASRLPHCHLPASYRTARH